MKRIVVFLLCVALLLASVAAATPRYVFADLDQHMDVLDGFFPTYLLQGVGYKLHDTRNGGNTTDFQLLVGEGYVQRLMWQDPTDGSNRFTSGVWNAGSALRFNIWRNELSLRYIQGFGQSPVEGKDLVTLIAYMNNRYERYYGESQIGPFPITGTLDKIHEFSGYYNGAVYPELAGNTRQFAGTELALSLKYDAMEDTLHTNDGYYFRVVAKYGPKILNNFTGDGFADYFTVSGNAVAAKTLWNYKPGTRSMVSFVAIDRANISYTCGAAVPSFVQAEVSLGRKVRGFNNWTYNTEYTTVNNFDLRIAGPGLGIDQIAPRLNLFFDCGYGWGKMFQETSKKEYSNFLASTGFQIELSVFDLFDLGFEVNYLLSDIEKYQKYTTPGSRITTNATFFLDF